MALRYGWLQKAADHAELTDEVLPGQTVVEVIGEGRVLVEGHNGISSYDDCEIYVKVHYGVVKISGSNLKLTVMTNNKLVISGAVRLIDLSRSAES